MVIEYIKHCCDIYHYRWFRSNHPLHYRDREVIAALFINHWTSRMLLTALSASLLNAIWLQGQLLCKVTLLTTFIEPFRVLEIPETFITHFAVYVSGILYYKKSKFSTDRQKCEPKMKSCESPHNLYF